LLAAGFEVSTLDLVVLPLVAVDAFLLTRDFFSIAIVLSPKFDFVALHGDYCKRNAKPSSYGIRIIGVATFVAEGLAVSTLALTFRLLLLAGVVGAFLLVIGFFSRAIFVSNANLINVHCPLCKQSAKLRDDARRRFNRPDVPNLAFGG
jgi:hypothetical protein